MQKKTYERHTFLSQWLTSLGVDPEIAAKDACRIEHVISAESFAAIKNILNIINIAPKVKYNKINFYNIFCMDISGTPV